MGNYTISLLKLTHLSGIMQVFTQLNAPSNSYYKKATKVYRKAIYESVHIPIDLLFILFNVIKSSWKKVFYKRRRLPLSATSSS